MAVLSREQINTFNDCLACKRGGYYDCKGCQHEFIGTIKAEHVIETMEYMQAELDRRKQELKKMRDQMLSNMDVSIKAISTQAERIRQFEEANVPEPIDDWHEDMGDCLWWKFPIEEPPYCGSPLDCNFPDYVTHFTRFLCPKEVEAE
jgi:hypothetical protein